MKELRQRLTEALESFEAKNKRIEKLVGIGRTSAANRDQLRVLSERIEATRNAMRRLLDLIDSAGEVDHDTDEVEAAIVVDLHRQREAVDAEIIKLGSTPPPVPETPRATSLGLSGGIEPRNI